MAIPINVYDLIENNVVESTRLEYKGGWNPERIMHTICAFTNDIDNQGGGYIILGIEEINGHPSKNLKGLEHDSIDDIGKKN